MSSLMTLLLPNITLCNIHLFSILYIVELTSFQSQSQGSTMKAPSLIKASCFLPAITGASSTDSKALFLGIQLSTGMPGNSNQNLTPVSFRPSTRKGLLEHLIRFSLMQTDFTQEYGASNSPASSHSFKPKSPQNSSLCGWSYGFNSQASQTWAQI